LQRRGEVPLAAKNKARAWRMIRKSVKRFSEKIMGEQ
jgi:hypothetical protein